MTSRKRPSPGSDFDSLRNLTQLGNIEKFLGKDFFKNLPIPDISTQFAGQPQDDDEFPPVDLYEHGRQTILVADIPGIRQATDVRLAVTMRSIVIAGTIPPPPVGDNAMILSERFTGAFERRVSLPTPVVETEVRATYKNGVLTVFLMKVVDQDDQTAGIIPIEFE